MKYAIPSVRYSVSETYIIQKSDGMMWRCRSVAPWHSPCPWLPASDERESERESERMSDTSPTHPSTTAELALTTPAPTHAHDSTSVSDVARLRSGLGLVPDGGVDDTDTMETDPEAVLSTITEIHDRLIQIGYANHLVVLASIAILNEAGVQPVKVKPIRIVANRLTDEVEFDRSNIATSLNALYGAEDEVGFIGRDWANRGNAYDWYVTEKGREAMGLLYEFGIIEALAAGDLTADID